MKKLYVGNLCFHMTDPELRSLFEAYGAIESSRIVINPETGRSRGFAIVAMPNDKEAQEAMAALNGKEIEGRVLSVNEARSN